VTFQITFCLSYIRSGNPGGVQSFVENKKVKALVNEILLAGEHSTIWNGRDSNNNRVGSGIYFYELNAGDYREVRKMVLLK
jgi:flagellar hook assembly protein FlgD